MTRRSFSLPLMVAFCSMGLLGCQKARPEQHSAAMRADASSTTAAATPAARAAQAAAPSGSSASAPADPHGKRFEGTIQAAVRSLRPANLGFTVRGDKVRVAVETSGANPACIRSRVRSIQAYANPAVLVMGSASSTSLCDCHEPLVSANSRCTVSHHSRKRGATSAMAAPIAGSTYHDHPCPLLGDRRPCTRRTLWFRARTARQCSVSPHVGGRSRCRAQRLLWC
jgi:hypothetical protein